MTAAMLRRKIHDRARDQDVLLTLDSVTDDSAAETRSGIETPQGLSAVGIKGSDNAQRVAIEHQVSPRRQNAAQQRQIDFVRPFAFSRHRIASVQPAGEFAGYLLKFKILCAKAQHRITMRLG